MANPSDTVTLQHENGSSVTVHLHGATVISWTVKGEDILFCSKQSVFDNKKAIRGGIPLVFPTTQGKEQKWPLNRAQFGPWSLGPQHGFARIKRWQLKTPPHKDGDQVTASFSLTDDEETRKMWDNRFKLVYTVRLSPDSLALSLQVNNTGTSKFDFTTLMHSYFRVPDITSTTISGLKGLTYSDKVHGGDHTEERNLVSLDCNYDRIYKDPPAQLSVRSVGSGQSAVEITTEKFPDIVVWNPWEEKARAMSDFGDEEYQNMICVEVGAVSRAVTLDPAADVTFSQNIKVLPTAAL